MSQSGDVAQVDWTRIRKLDIKYSCRPMGVRVNISVSRRPGEGIRESVIEGPIATGEALALAYRIACRGFEPHTDSEGQR